MGLPCTFDLAAAIPFVLSDIDVRNDQLVTGALGAINFNPSMQMPRRADNGNLAPAGWFGYSSTGRPAYVDDTARDEMRIGGPSALRVANAAFRVNTGTEYEFVVLAKLASGTGSIQLDAYEISADLATGKRAVGGATDRETEIHAVSNIVSVLSATALSTSYAVYSGDYVPSSSAKWASLNIHTVSETDDVHVEWAIVREKSTRGAPSGTNVGDTSADDISTTIEGAGQLTENLAAGDGVTYRSVARGVAAGSATDGQAISFSPTWDNVPTVRFMAGGLAYNASLTGDQTLDFSALGLSGSGFTARLKMKELASTTQRTDTTVSTPSSPSGLDHSINKSQTDEAYDDKYTFQFDVTVTNFSTTEPGLLTVGLYTNDGSGWVLRDSVMYAGSLGETSSTRLNQTRTVTVDGLGLNDDFGINIESGSGSLNFDSVKYETATTPTTESATPSGASAVDFLVLGG